MVRKQGLPDARGDPAWRGHVMCVSGCGYRIPVSHPVNAQTSASCAIRLSVGM